MSLKDEIRFAPEERSREDLFVAELRVMDRNAHIEGCPLAAALTDNRTSSY